MLVLLLLVLWLPLLVFSSGAPTYQTPTVVNAAVNISLVSGAALERVHQLCYSVTNSVSLGNAFTAPATHAHPLLMRVLHRLVVMLALVVQVSVVAHFP